MIPINTQVHITSCGHSDVVPGQTGTVTGHRDGGYEVTTEGNWIVSGANQTRQRGTETVWCEQVEAV